MLMLRRDLFLFLFSPESKCVFFFICCCSCCHCFVLFAVLFDYDFCFVNVWISIWDGSLVGLNMTPKWALCVCCMWWGRRCLMRLPWWSLISPPPPIKLNLSSIDYFPCPWQPRAKPHNQQNNLFKLTSYVEFFLPSCQQNRVNLLKTHNVRNRFPNRENINYKALSNDFFFKEKVYTFCFVLFWFSFPFHNVHFLRKV